MSMNSMMNETMPINFNTIEIKTLPVYNIEDYDLFDEKDLHKYITDIERICRNSYEYKEFIKFLKYNMDMKACAIYENVNLDLSDPNNYNKIAIHIHHDPLTLYEITKIIVNKRIQRRENLDEQLACKEIMLLHYNLLVGLIPLAETVHELVHNQYLFVPTTSVFGFYREFIEMYDQYIDSELKEKIERMEAATAMYDGSDKYILDTHLIYCDLSGVRQLPKYEDVRSFLSNRISEIDNGLPLPHQDIHQVSSITEGIKGKCPWDIFLE